MLLRLRNLLVVSRDNLKCNNGIKRKNSAGRLSIIKSHTLSGPNKKVCHFAGFQLDLPCCIVKNYMKIYLF